MEIVRAGKEHTLQIIEVWREFIQFNIEAELLWNPGENAAGEFEKQLTEQLKSGNDLVLVAIEESRVVGFAVATIGGRPKIFRVAKYGTISDIGIKKEFRHQGIGERLLAEIMSWFKTNNVALAEVAVLAKNQVATSFWAKQGFQGFSHRMYRLIAPQ